MTDQRPERFLNANERVDLSCLELYFVSADLPIEPCPPDDHLSSTGLYRGYVATWRLNDDGTLELLRFEFPNYIEPRVVVQEVAPTKIQGDFPITFRPFFHGPNTEIPFRNGHVIEDRANWSIEDQRLTAQVTESLGEAGLVARTIGGVGFIPRTFLSSPDVDLDSLVGKRVQCLIHDRDEERRSFIYKPVAEFENDG